MLYSFDTVQLLEHSIQKKQLCKKTPDRKQGARHLCSDRVHPATGCLLELDNSSDFRGPSVIRQKIQIPLSYGMTKISNGTILYIHSNDCISFSHEACSFSQMI